MGGQYLNYQIPVLGVLLLYGITFFIVLPWKLKDKAHSFYFDHDPADPEIVRQVMSRNSERFMHARQYLGQNQRFNPKILQTDSSKLDISIGVITTQRSIEKERNIHLGYLSQVLAAFHKLSEDDTHFGKKNLFICNVDLNGVRYDEARRWSVLVNMTIKFADPDVHEPQPEPWEKYEKEKKDYQYCLKHATTYGSPLVLLVEDDVVPNDNFFPILYRQVLMNRIISLKSDHGALGFVKLYYPEKWAGYGNEIWHFIEIITFGAFGGFMFYTMWTMYKVCVLKSSVRKYYSTSNGIVIIIGVVYAICIVLVSGRPDVLRYTSRMWNWYSIVNAKQCCTQAMLYSASAAEDLVGYLDSVECDIDHPIDIAIDTFGVEHELKNFLIEPNIVTHIGMFSSLRPYGKSAGEFL